MGSAMALLTGVTQAASGSATQGEAGASGTDFLGALLAAAPAAPADFAAESLLPAPQATDEASTDTATAAELAALIAALLPVAAAVATPAGADASEAVEGEAQVAGAATSPAKALEQLLQRLAQEAGATDQEQAPALVAPAAPAAKLPDDAGLHQLLRAMAPRATATEPQVTMPKPGARSSDAPASQVFALPQAAAEVALRATDITRQAADVQPGQLTALDAGIEVAAPTLPQSPQVQPQVAALAQPQQFQAATPATTQTVHNPVGSPRWADELGSRMMLMTVRGQHEGSLSLTPEHLGPLEVRVSVNQGTANVWFGAQHADTRAALAEALPRLRELFADAGLMLGHAGVSQEAPRQAPREHESMQLVQGGKEAVGGVDEAAAPMARRIALGLVDTYA
jgi:flagellar hook-length control protein FliK